MAIHRATLSAALLATIVISLARPSIQRTVYVINNLRDRILIVHCRSKDSDLGGHAVAVGDGVRWSFEPNVFGTTLFWCKLAVEDKRLSFVAYEDSGKNSREWYVEDGGVYGGVFFSGRRFFKAAWNVHA